MIRRREMLATSSAAVLAAPPFVQRANAQSAFDWKQFKGQSIEINFQLSPRGDLVRNNIKAFEELTGIKAGFEQIPEQQQRPKVAMEMATGHPASTSSMSGCMSRSVWSKRPNGWRICGPTSRTNP